MRLNAPVPGSSLTGTPKGNAWERPPEMNNPEDVLQFHLENLERPEVIEAVMDALDLGMDIKTLVEGITRGGVAAGRHSIDTSIMIAPIIHEYIKGTADALGVAYKEGIGTDEETRKEMKRAKKILVTKRLDQAMQAPKETDPSASAPETPSRGIASRPGGME